MSLHAGGDAPSARWPTLTPDSTLLDVGSTTGLLATARCCSRPLQTAELLPARRVSIFYACVCACTRQTRPIAPESPLWLRSGDAAAFPAVLWAHWHTGNFV